MARKIKFGIVVFPGSNCDHDAYHVTKHILDQDAAFLWHKDSDLQDCDVIVLPGGFAYGDYLRAGAVARFSPIMKEVVQFAEKGGYVMGICNGFQVLTETGLLPGALMRNLSLRFVSRTVNLRVETSASAFTSAITPGTVLRIPVAHGEGNFYTDEITLRELESSGRVLFRYSDPAGAIIDEANPNGSMNNIAGITNERGNVLGMMPHPERAAEAILGTADGLGVFRSLAASLTERLQ